MTLKEALNSISTEGLVIEIDEATRQKLQRELLGMYKDILAVCQKHDIIPYLCGGSSLGAIRHKGFIPWDDDLDVAMTRADYQRFVQIFDSELSDKYVLNAPNYSKVSMTRFPKVMKKGTVFMEIGALEGLDFQGIPIDIFIIENVPENAVHRKLKGLYCNFLEFVGGRVLSYQARTEYSERLHKAVGMKSYYFNKVIGFLFSFRKASRWNDSVDKAVQYHKESKLCNLATGRKHYFGEIH